MNTNQKPHRIARLFEDGTASRSPVTALAPESAPDRPAINRAPADPLLTGEQVDEALGIKKTKRYELLKKGELPKPVYLGLRCVRWRRSAIEAYIASLTPSTGHGASA